MIIQLLTNEEMEIVCCSCALNEHKHASITPNIRQYNRKSRNIDGSFRYTQMAYTNSSSFSSSAYNNSTKIKKYLFIVIHRSYIILNQKDELNCTLSEFADASNHLSRAHGISA